MVTMVLYEACRRTQLERYSGISTLDSRTVIRRLGLADYAPTYAAMRRFTDERERLLPTSFGCSSTGRIHGRDPGRAEHFRARRQYGRAGRPRRADHLSRPGQAIVYALVDLARRGLTVRTWWR